MKNIFLGLGLFLCSLLSLVIVMTLTGISVRQNELNHGVQSALHDTVEYQMQEPIDGAESNAEFVEDCIQALLLQIGSDSTIEVRVLAVDYEKGLLAVEAKSKFQHLIGTDGEVAVKRAVIREQYEVPVS